MRAQGRPYRDAGFTLVELLVVLVVGGLVTALLINGFRAINTAWRSMSGRDEAVARDAALRTYLKEVLSQCYPAIILGPDDRQTVAFTGVPTAMTFLGPLPQRFGVTDIVQYRLRYANSTLVLDWRLDRADADDQPPERWAELVIATGITAPLFQYFGAPSAQTPSQWQSSWHRNDALPELIDIRLAGATGKTSSSDMLVAPLTTALFCQPTDRIQCRS